MKVNVKEGKTNLRSHSVISRIRRIQVKKENWKTPMSKIHININRSTQPSHQWKFKKSFIFIYCRAVHSE